VIAGVYCAGVVDANDVDSVVAAAGD